MNNTSDQASMCYDAGQILDMVSTRNTTSVERMSRRWIFTNADAICPGQPEFLLAPRFGKVPPLRIECPHSDQAWEVRVTGWMQIGWFTHLQVSHPGASYPVTLTGRYSPSRPVSEVRGTEPDASKQIWESYALTVPPGTLYIEIGKLDEMEACLVAVEFIAVDNMPEPAAPMDKRPIVAGIMDQGILISETLQTYESPPLEAFYQQMSDQGFTHFFAQVYNGTTAWSDAAPPWSHEPYGHKSYANWNEPTYHHLGDAQGVARDIERVNNAGMKYIASFRINNEWLASWALDFLDTADGKWPAKASRYSVEHPEHWMTYKSGDRTGGGLDFAFEEVREYRLNLIRSWCELFENYAGINLDLYRHPPMVSYPEHLVQAFKAETGVDVRTIEPIDKDTTDPRWLKFRAAEFTKYMQSVHDLVRGKCGGQVTLSARVANTMSQALRDGADLEVWFERKLVDLLVLQHRPPANPLEADTRDLIAMAHDHGVRVVHLFGGNYGIDPAPRDTVPHLDLLNQWRDWGSDGFGFYEGERIVRDGVWLKRMPELTRNWTNRA